MAFIKLIDRFVGELNDLVKYFKQRSKNKYYGDCFEEWVVKHSNIKKKKDESNGKNYFWELLEWRSDKYVEGYAANSNSYPDLQLRCLNTESLVYNVGETIAVECKWRAKSTIWIEEYKVEIVKKFWVENSNIKSIFYIIGIGWQDNAPEKVYLIDLTEISKIEVETKIVKNKKGEYEKTFIHPIDLNKLKSLNLQKYIMYSR